MTIPHPPAPLPYDGEGEDDALLPSASLYAEEDVTGELLAVADEADSPADAVEYPDDEMDRGLMPDA